MQTKYHTNRFSLSEKFTSSPVFTGNLCTTESLFTLILSVRWNQVKKI